MPIATGVAQIRHAESGEVYRIEPGELIWDTDGGDEREMGQETTYVAEVEHPELGTLTWRLWEYPLGALNDRETDVGKHTVVSDFSVILDDAFYPDFEPKEQEVEVDELVSWFFERFEDPAERTPYESAEGGYQWIWGGPHDAHEELSNNFPEVSERLIKAAVDRIQSQGIFEWAPVAGPGDYDDLESDGHDAPEDEDGDRFHPRPADVEWALSDLRQVGLGPEFGLDANARVSLVRWTPSETLLPEGLGDRLREAAGLLVAKLQGTNAHTDLLDAAERYAAALDRSPLSIDELYAEGVFFENAVERLHADIADGDAPALPRAVEQPLKTQLELHGAFIMASPEGRALVEGAAAYRRTSEQQAALDRSTLQLSTLIEQAQDLFTPEVRELVARAVTNVGAGPHPARSNQLAQGIIGRVLAGVALGVGFCASAVAVTIIGDGLAATPLGAAAMQAVTAAGTIIPPQIAAAYANFVVANAAELKVFAALAGPEFGWLSRLTSLVPSNWRPKGLGS